jgi:hypothetical protein
MCKALLVAGVFCLVVLAGPARAAAACTEAICFTFTEAGREFLNQVGLTEDEVQKRLNSELGRFFQTTDTAGYVRRFSDSQSFTGKGMGVDYASEATFLEVGAAGSVAMGIDRTYKPASEGSGAGFPISGVGLNASLMAGASLDPLGVPLMFFGNWMRINGLSYGQLTGQLENWGLHAQLRLFGPSRSVSAMKMLARWGGIAITTGVDSSHMNLRAGQTIKTGQIDFSDMADSSTTIDVSSSVNGQARFEMDMLTRSIPLEVTTSFRLLTLLTVYGGIGMDWQVGGGSNLNVKVKDATITGKANGTTADLGTVDVDAQASASPSSTVVRGLVGAQVNLALLRLFAQLNVANTDPVVASVIFGARLAY